VRTLVAGVALLLLAGCGGEDGETRLRLDTERWDEKAYDVVDVHFSLRCDPAGGTLPHPKAACEALEAHPEMTEPPEETGTCAGSDGIPPSVSVTGLFHGREVNVGVRSCDHPEARGHAATLWLVAAGLLEEGTRP
jgi:subtilisin inhibitor-like